MSNKTYKLIFGVITGIEVIAEAVVAYTNPAYETAIVAAIPLVSNCVLAVSKLFVKD